MPWGIFLFVNLFAGFLALQAMPLIHIHDESLIAYALLSVAAATMTIATVAVLRPLYFPSYSRFATATQRQILAGATVAALVMTIGIAHIVVANGLACECLTRLPLMEALRIDTAHVVTLLLAMSIVYMVSIWSITEAIKTAIRRVEA